MTQTIKHCNETPAGKTYPVEHLRTAESIEQLCAYVDAGHPIAWVDGGEAKLLQKHDERFNCYRAIKEDWQHQTIRIDTLTHFVKLAPIAYRNGRQLHVGDVIEVLRDYGTSEPAFEPCKACCAHATTFNRGENSQEWRFADEVAE